MKDTRPEKYCITTKRTVAELTKEELEIVVCDFIDAWADARQEINALLEPQMELIEDEIIKYK